MASEGLVVYHRNREGRVKEFDFATLSAPRSFQLSLATLFGARCEPNGWGIHRTSERVWFDLRLFTDFIATQPETVNDLQDLSGALLKRWRLHVKKTRGRSWLTVSGLLRQDPRLQSGPVAEELARRVAVPRNSTQSYEEAEFQKIKSRARRDVRAALNRIEHNARHLERWLGGDFEMNSPDWLIGEALNALAQTGSMPEYHLKNTATQSGAKILKKRYRGPLGGTSAEVTWQRLFLTRMEATALAVLLVAECGWNLSVINTVKTPKAEPDPDEDRPTYRVELMKRRRGTGRQHETRNFTDDGGKSEGRLITYALQATRFARAIVAQQEPGTDLLIVWRTGNRGSTEVHGDKNPALGSFRFGVSSFDAQTWASRHGLPAGSPFRRARRTVVAVNSREPKQHSQQTFEEKYVLADRRVHRESVEVFARGAEDALRRAQHTVLVATMKPTPQPGDVETATADCSDPTSSPFGVSTAGTCTASFFLCLACPNAHVHPGHHRRLAFLHSALTNMRSALTPDVWDTRWRDHHARLEDLRRRLGEPVWNRALSDATDADRVVIDHLLSGALDS